MKWDIYYRIRKKKEKGKKNTKYTIGVGAI